MLLKKARQARGLTQKQLAYVADIHQSQVSDAESGLYRFAMEIEAKLMVILDIQEGDKIEYLEIKIKNFKKLVNE